MHQVLLYSTFLIAILALFFSFYAGARVGKFLSATKDLDWDAVANMTGDLATTKKTIQTLNNRINGMHSPKLQEQELMLQLLQSKQNTNPKASNGALGG
tara:strand:- start:251 stop:547 length:297 start_codon:yes stop_codon:yes gene_type:complete